MADKTLQFIRQKEGYSSTAYWDNGAYRIGYGSDTMTNADGTVLRVTKSSTTTKPDAERDLVRRVPEFQKSGVIAYVGQDAWDAMSSEAKAAVTSVAYNYGSLKGLPSLVKAIKSGDNNAIGNAIADRAVDGPFKADGTAVNSGRRKSEAALVLGHPSVPGDLGTDKVEGMPMPRSAGVEARLKAARRDALITGGKVATVGASAAPASAAATTYRGAENPISLGDAPAGRQPAPAVKAPVAGLRLPVAPTTVLSGEQGVWKTNSGVAGKVAMPADARPSSLPKVATNPLLMPTKAPVAGLRLPAAPAVKAPLAKPAPLEFSKPVYKTISVLNPAYQDDIGRGAGSFDSLAAFKQGGAAAGAAVAGAPATKAVPKYIEKRVLATPAKPIKPAAVAAVAAKPVAPAGAAAAAAARTAQGKAIGDANRANPNPTSSASGENNAFMSRDYQNSVRKQTGY